MSPVGKATALVSCFISALPSPSLATSQSQIDHQVADGHAGPTHEMSKSLSPTCWANVSYELESVKRIKVPNPITSNDLLWF